MFLGFAGIHIARVIGEVQAVLLCISRRPSAVQPSVSRHHVGVFRFEVDRNGTGINIRAHQKQPFDIKGTEAKCFTKCLAMDKSQIDKVLALLGDKTVSKCRTVVTRPGGIHHYMQFRAAQENQGMELLPDWFLAHAVVGYKFFFGVDVTPHGNILRDRQNEDAFDAYWSKYCDEIVQSRII